MDNSISFRWLGVAGTELRVDNRTLVIDPYFTRISMWSSWFGRVEPDHRLIADKLQECDLVLITHAHFDHIMDVPDVANNTGATALGSPNACRLLSVCGVPEERIRKIKTGDKIDLNGFEVTAFPAVHMKTPGFSPGPLSPALQPPLKARDYRMDDDFSFLISIGEYRLLTDPGERPLGIVPADILFVFPFRNYTYYQALLSQVQPRVVIPTHWDDFFRPLSKPLRPTYHPPRWAVPPVRRINLTEFNTMIKQIAPRTRVIIPEIFHTYDITELTDSLKW
ncbi:MAG: MBL fold metallo-hydrolase [Dehalococcoidia bacterium]|nr:MBL fold metallo-hydrolase [Dehalococcoidia bacterium]